VATAALHAHDKTLIESHPDSESLPQVALTRGLTELRAALATNPLRLSEVLNLVTSLTPGTGCNA
jgi:hypothetical protein